MAEKRNGDEKRILENHKSNLAEVVKKFRVLVEADRFRTSTAPKIDPRKGIWELSPFRADMKREMTEIARMIDSGEGPQDLDVRIARLALAMYLLDKSKELLDAATESRKPSMTVLFHMAISAVSNILDPAYFKKTPDRIIQDYLNGQAAMVACAECAGVQLHTLEAAVKQYQDKAAREIELILGVE